MSAARLAVVDLGLGNIHSLLGCLRRLAGTASVALVDDAEAVREADAVVLPGDGSFSACVAEVDARPGMRAALEQAAQERPFLAICVGMQLLYEGSEEGAGAGLGLLPGTVRRFPSQPGAKIPLMGWLDARLDSASPYCAGLRTDERFYFLHSYYAAAAGDEVLMRAEHTAPFAAAAARDGLLATQFHPEKSAAAGCRLLANFLRHAGLPVDNPVDGPVHKPVA